MSGVGQFYQWITQASQQQGARRSVYSPETTLSRRSLVTRCERRSRELFSLGVRRGDVVMLALGNVVALLLGAEDVEGQDQSDREVAS